MIIEWTYISCNEKDLEEVEVKYEKTLFQSIFRLPQTIKNFVLDSEEGWVHKNTNKKVSGREWFLAEQVKQNHYKGSFRCV